MSNIQIKMFACAQICYIVAIWCALQLFPGANTTSTMLALIGSWGLIATIYKSCHHRNSAGWWTLLTCTTFLAIGIIANVHYFTTVSGGTTAFPTLNNPDAFRYYCDALETSNLPGGIEAPPSQRGYGMIISLIWKITGVTIVAPLILNMIFTLLCIIASGVISERVINTHSKHSSAWISTCAMILTASICYYLTSGTVLLKEAPLCFALAICALALSSILKGIGNISRTDFTLFIIGIIIISIIRYSFIPFIINAITITYIFVAKSSHRKVISPLLSMFIICITAYIITVSILSLIEHSAISKTAEIIKGNEATGYFYASEYHHVYDQAFGDYFSYPIWKRILCLPISAITQFLIPFPWNFGRDTIYGYTLDYAHIAYPWYLIGGLIIYFIFVAQKTAPSSLKTIVLTGIILWLIPAYLFAGTVSRYTLPFVPLLIPAAVYVIDSYLHKNSLRIWGYIYCTLLAITLITCYHLQQSGLQ